MVQILKSVKEKQQKKKEVESRKNKNGNTTTTNRRKFIKEGFFTFREGIDPIDKRPGDNYGSTENVAYRMWQALVYSTIALVLHTFIGYSTACMLTRYSYYIEHEDDEENAGKPAFLGINGEVDKKTGKVDFSHVYYKGGNDDDNDDNDDDDEMVTSLGIQKEDTGHENVIPAWSFNNSLEDINRTKEEDDKSPLRLRKIAAMNMSTIRKSYKQLMGFLITKTDPNNTEIFDTNKRMMEQTARWYFVLYPLLMVIGAIIITPLITLVTSTFVNGPASKGTTDGGPSAYLFGFVEGIMDMIVYTFYGLGVVLGGHFHKDNVRSDFFKPPNEYNNPDFNTYLTSVGSTNFLLIWAVMTIIMTGIYVPETTGEKFTVVCIPALIMYINGYFRPNN